MSADEVVPGRLRRLLESCLAENLPANVALMRLIIEAASPSELAAMLADQTFRDEVSASRVRRISDLLREHPDAFATVKSVMREADHGGIPAGSTDPTRAWAGVFDRLARTSPLGGVALYSLGSTRLLGEATAEVVACLREWRLIGPASDVLELGCGIGRFVAALSPLVRTVTGLDLSAAMVDRAREACAGLSNVRLRQTEGFDLAGVEERSIDLLLAADVFPYIVGVESAARRHVEEAGRVLRPSGALLILNYSYRGDPDADAREFAALCADTGLTVERSGTRDLEHWDAVAYLARRPA